MEALVGEQLELLVRETLSCLRVGHLDVLWHLSEVSKVLLCRIHFLKVI